MKTLENTIRDAIQGVNANIREHPLAFLTESDIQCQLYAALLLAYGCLDPVSNTFVWGTTQPRALKPIQSMRLHSELLLPEDVKVETVDVLTFIGRMVQHILPKGFQRVCYYGLQATKTFKKWCEAIKNKGCSE